MKQGEKHKERMIIMNTTEFNHFKLNSDGTLKSMTKEELIDYIHMLYHNWKVTDEAYMNVMELARKLSK